MLPRMVVSVEGRVMFPAAVITVAEDRGEIVRMACASIAFLHENFIFAVDFPTEVEEDGEYEGTETEISHANLNGSHFNI